MTHSLITSVHLVLNLAPLSLSGGAQWRQNNNISDIIELNRLKFPLIFQNVLATSGGLSYFNIYRTIFLKKYSSAYVLSFKTYIMSSPCLWTLMCNHVPSFDKKEDPRLKYPVHMRNKNSMEPGDLGPLPVSIVIIRPSAHLCIASLHSLISWDANCPRYYTTICIYY